MTVIELDAEGYPLNCTGCGTMKAQSEYGPGVTCCPERQMRRHPMLCAWVDHVALAMINAQVSVLDWPTVDSMDDLRNDADAVAFRCQATVAITALCELGWRPRP